MQQLPRRLALFRGNGKHLSDWFGFGQPVYAVANGVVVRAINNRPEARPFTDNQLLSYCITECSAKRVPDVLDCPFG